PKVRLYFESSARANLWLRERRRHPPKSLPVRGWNKGRRRFCPDGRDAQAESQVGDSVGGSNKARGIGRGRVGWGVIGVENSPLFSRLGLAPVLCFQPFTRLSNRALSIRIFPVRWPESGERLGPGIDRIFMI